MSFHLPSDWTALCTRDAAICAEQHPEGATAADLAFLEQAAAEVKEAGLCPAACDPAAVCVCAGGGEAAAHGAWSPTGVVAMQSFLTRNPSPPQAACAAVPLPKRPRAGTLRGGVACTAAGAAPVPPAPSPPVPHVYEPLPDPARLQPPREPATGESGPLAAPQADAVHALRAHQPQPAPPSHTVHTGLAHSQQMHRACAQMGFICGARAQELAMFRSRR